MRGLLERLLARHRRAADEGITDAELLRRFTRDRDESAFELLVWRHGAMVLGLCRRAIGDEQLAEDAFQTVFLVLSRKAGGVRGNLGGWLFKVARRVSARAASQRRPVHPVAETASEPQPDLTERQELTDLLDAEVARLPERLRKPVVLCYLGGHSTEDAARELGCPRGTVLSRLATARTRLAERLARRGVVLPATISVAGISLTGRVVSSATTAARRFRFGSLEPGPVTHLAEGVIQTMNRGTLLTAFGGTLLAVTLVSGVGWVAAQQGTRVEPAGDVAAPVAKANTELVNAPPQPPEPGAIDEDKKVRDQIKNLALEALHLKAQLQKREKEFEQLAEEIEKRAVRRAALQKQFDEVEAEYQKLSREIVKMEAELAVLKRRVARPVSEPEAALIQQEMSRDASLKDLSSELQSAQKQLRTVVEQGTGEMTPLVQKQKEKVAELEKRCDALQTSVRGEITARLKLEISQSLRDRIAKQSMEVEIQKEVLEVIRSRRDASARMLDDAISGTITQTTRDADFDAKRDSLAKIQAEITRLQLKREGIVTPHTEGTEAKLDSLIREIGELRKEIRELKSKK
ncbi:ECF RNA polymerase sigma-E factor [Gemmata sp. SH-PL17]|nr:ECF RNA polymerase sigma-E factor [Gemmata sp. SH-PL17]